MTLIKVKGRGAENLGRRRLNPNGAMMVSQRATTKATLTNGYNCLDRVFTYKSHDGVVEESQSTDTPNSDFYNSMKHRVTTADTSIAASQYHALSFRLEGNSVTQLAFGTSGAKKVTVSFWVKSSVAGAYGTCLRSSDANRFNMQTMTINSADTWEKKSITYTGDTSGTWPKDNTEGFQFQLSMAMGTTYHGTSADAWVGTVDVAPSNQVNWLATVGNTFYLTGLQIEEGDKATDFEHLSFAEELALCQRYCQIIKTSDGYPQYNGHVNNSAGTYVAVPFTVDMRTPPTGITVTNVGSWGHVVYGVLNRNCNSITFGSASSKTISLDMNDASGGFTLGNGSMLYDAESGGNVGMIEFTGAEL